MAAMALVGKKGSQYANDGSDAHGFSTDGGIGSCHITGGSFSISGALAPTPTNGSDTVYLTTITLDGVTEKISVSVLTITLTGTSPYTYGTGGGMMTDTSGKLYIWLPEGAETTKAQTPVGDDYVGLVMTTTDASISLGTFGLCDNKSPVVISITPNSGSTWLSGDIVITFNETMDTLVGTVSLDGDATLTGGVWSNNNKTYTIAYAVLSHDTEYTISLSGFADLSANLMEDGFTQTFTTIPSCGNGAYYIETDGDSAYTAGYTKDGLLNLTVNVNQSGFTYFGVDISAVTGHSGSEACLFVHIRNGVQMGIMAFKDDFDSGGIPCAAFNVQTGDVIEVYIVDKLTNDESANPTVL